ncbi:MAG: hypothetical protein HY728_10015 [Candidatus Rokubacteria bacterium]|nr:hypothetical protein [Candidatus Rokubacteria bacterium]
MTVRWVLLALGVTLLVLPSANYHVFGGLPLSRVPEFIAFVLVLPLFCARGVRRLCGRALCRGPAWLGRLLLAAMALAVVAKVAMLASGTHDGFLGCYRFPVASPPAALACEKSYEDPFFRFGVTRVDHTVDFSGGNWDLSFINSLRFNIYPWVRGNVLRDRLPLAVTWEGIIEGADPRLVRIVYVGEGTAGFGPLVVSLPPQYRTAAAVTVPVPPGRHRVRIDYKFDDGYRVGDGAFPGPYAVFGILDAAGHPLRARPPGWAWLVLANVIDGVIAVLLVALLVLYVRVLKGYTVIVGALGLVAALAWMVSREVVAQVVVPEALLLVVASFLVLAFTRRHRSRHVIAAYFGCFAASVLRARLDFGALGAVLYQPAGDDWLTYESFARSILESWSLEAGEPVFYYQPLFRYLRFVEHFVIGDGDALIAVCALALLNFALFWLIGFVWPRSRSIRARVVVVASALLLAIVLNSDSVVGLLNVGASEYPTWIALLFGVPMLVRSERPRHLVLGTLLAVGSLLMRLNQRAGLAGPAGARAAARGGAAAGHRHGGHRARRSGPSGRSQRLLRRAARADHDERSDSDQPRPTAPNRVPGGLRPWGARRGEPAGPQSILPGTPSPRSALARVPRIAAGLGRLGRGASRITEGAFACEPRAHRGADGLSGCAPLLPGRSVLPAPHRHRPRGDGGSVLCRGDDEGRPRRRRAPAGGSVGMS